MRPPRGTPERSEVNVRAAQSPKVLAASASDPIATEEPTSKQLAVPGGNPVWALPGDRQRQPVRTVNPELVIVEAAVTAQSFELGPRVRPMAMGAKKRPRVNRKWVVRGILEVRGV